MPAMTYNKLSGWVKVDGVRVGQNRPTGRVLRLPMEAKHHGLPAHKVVKEEVWIWKLQTGMDPVGDIVHLNGDPFDNRWKNLRDQDGLEVEAKDDLNGPHSAGNLFQSPDGSCQFFYDPTNGRILNRRENVVKMSDDRPVVWWAGEWFAAEEVAWFLGTGVWPERGVRQVNGEYGDLRLANLRRII